MMMKRSTAEIEILRRADNDELVARKSTASRFRASRIAVTSVAS
jgi:hypothetical protein